MSAGPIQDCEVVYAFAPALSKDLLNGNCCGDLSHVTCQNNRVTEIRVNNMNLGRGIPNIISRLDQLRSLNASSAGLTDRVPDEIGTLANLEVLDLSGNPKLSGSLPSRTRGMAKLQTLYAPLPDLRDTGLNGALPELPLPLRTCRLPKKSQFRCYTFSPSTGRCTFSDSTDFVGMGVCSDPFTGATPPVVITEPAPSSSSSSLMGVLIPVMIIGVAATLATVWWTRRRRVKYSKLREAGMGLGGGAQVPLQDVGRFRTLKLQLDLSGCLVFNLAIDHLNPNAAGQYHTMTTSDGADSYVSPAVVVDHWQELFVSCSSYATRWLEAHDPAVAAHLWELATGTPAASQVYQSSFASSAALTHLIGAAVVDFLQRFIGSELYGVLGLSPAETSGQTFFAELCSAVMRASVTSGDSAFATYLDDKLEECNARLRSRTALDVNVQKLLQQALERMVNIKMHKPHAALVQVQTNAALVEAVMNADMSTAILSGDAAKGRTSQVAFCVFPGILDASTNSVLERARVWLAEHRPAIRIFTVAVATTVTLHLVHEKLLLADVRRRLEAEAAQLRTRIDEERRAAVARE
ncbi:hypothetical protein H9P43_000686 [Blastocladiella emersonii ATCC 22665]|nr:hypothetical protein H9P43_000686 [Blastocladiella emersonii ATCC 22665]